MLVKGWMNTQVITVGEGTPMAKASIIMKENNIRTVPVMNKKSALIGIVTDRDIRDASPSMATSLNIHELNYLISRVKVKDIMSTDLVVVAPDETIEFAAILMLDNKISSLPVLNEKGALVGIITQTDIFRSMIHITGIYTGGVQFALSLEDRSGSIREVADEIRSFDARIVSILSTRQGAEAGRHNVYIRIRPLAENEIRRLLKRLEDQFTVLYSARDVLEEVEKRRVRKMAA
jgi:acetoin utilization protein AcuB